MTLVKRRTAVAVLLCVVGLILYSPSLRLGFVWDDNYQIVRNPFLHSDEPVSRVLTSDVWGYMLAGKTGMSNYYRPLQMLTYRWIAEIGGMNPTAFHLASVLLNLLACLAAYLCLWQLTKNFWISGAAALLFALHPIHSEAVLWVAALTELGCALFYFLAFWLFLLSRERPPEDPKRKRLAEPSGARRRWLLVASCACALAALLWKEMALTFAVTVAAYVFFFSPQESWWGKVREAVVASIPFWVVTAIYAGLRVAVLGYFSKVHHPLVMTPTQFFATTAELLAEYWLKLALPLRLNAFHVLHIPHSLFEWRPLLAFAFLLITVAAIAYNARRAPLASFTASWVLITLVPVLNLQGIGQNAFTERYLYIPSLGFVLLLTWLVARGVRSSPERAVRIGSLVALALLTIGCAGEVWARVPAWATDRALYTATAKLSPDAPLILNSLAQIRRDEDGDYDGAERGYKTALAAAKAQGDKDQIANSYVGLAGIASRRGRYEEALQYTYQGFAEGSDLIALHVSQGVLLMQLGRFDLAKQILEETNKIFPYDEVVHNSLGLIAMSQKDYPRAYSEFESAVRIAPNFADGYNNLGRAYSDGGRANDSIACFERAVALAPNNPLFLTNLGVGLARQGRYAEARVQLQRALEIDPNFPGARANLQTLNRVLGQGS